jgi:N-acetylglucosamine malate deacetylase 1
MDDMKMRKILVIAPHNDDEILGVGGTMAKHIDAGEEVYVCVVSNHDVPLYTKEQMQRTKDESKRAHEYLSIKKTFYLDFPAVILREISSYKINNAILEVVKNVEPDIAYIPHFGDIHTDHTITAISSMVALRPNGGNQVHSIYAYETLSETEWNIPHAAHSFIPNVFSDISAYIEQKINAMMMFQSQIYPPPNARSLQAIRTLAAYRGSTINVQAAEAFMLMREVS